MRPIVHILRWWNGGLVFYGSVIGGLLIMIWFVRREGIRFIPIVDLAEIPMLVPRSVFPVRWCLGTRLLLGSDYGQELGDSILKVQVCSSSITIWA